MTTKSPFGEPLGKKYGKRVEILFKAEGQHLYNIYWSLWRQLGLKKSLLMIWKILGLFVAHWLPMTSIVFLKGAIYCNIVRCNYLRHEKLFLNFFFQFSKFKCNFEYF